MFPDAIRRADLLARYRPMMESLDAVLATYVWLDAGEGVRSKTKTLSFEPQSLQQVPQWANAADWFYGPELPLTTEMRMIPVRLYADPLLGGHHKLILCELVTFDEGTPIKCNRRAQLTETAQRAIVQESQFRFQQEYYLFEGKNRFHPLGWPEEGGLPAETGPAAVGANAIVGRDLAEAHYRACLAAGVNIAGASAANGLAKWTFEVSLRVFWLQTCQILQLLQTFASLGRSR